MTTENQNTQSKPATQALSDPAGSRLAVKIALIGIFSGAAMGFGLCGMLMVWEPWVWEPWVWHLVGGVGILGAILAVGMADCLIQFHNENMKVCDGCSEERTKDVHTTA